MSLRRHSTIADHYLEEQAKRPFASYEERYRTVVRRLSLFHPITPSTRVLEIGIGAGWFPILCARDGIACAGLDVTPQLIEHARDLAARLGVSIEVRLGNIEDTRLDPDSFDIVIADSIFEHVRNWRTGLANVAHCLRGGGVLMLVSTNKFALTSGEFSFPLYGWLPDRTRYWLRRVLEGADVMKFGIDFHQFTYRGLRRALKQAGFSRVYDPVDFLDPQRLSRPCWWKTALLRTMRNSELARHALLTFWPSTDVFAVK